METMATLVTAQRIRRVLVLHCRGELDLATRDELWSELAALADLPAGGDRTEQEAEREPDLDAVVVDLAEVTFLDCSAVGILVRLLHRCRQADRHFLLCSPGPNVRRLLTVLGLDRVLVVARTTQEAVALAEDRPPAEPSSGPVAPLRQDGDPPGPVRDPTAQDPGSHGG